MTDQASAPQETIKTQPTPGQLDAAHRLAQTQKTASKAIQENLARAEESIKEAVEHGEKIVKTFYSRISGMTHVFKDGTRAVFTNGEYHARFKHEIEELEALILHPANFLIHDHQVPVQNPEGVTILKDVSQAGTGIVSSSKLIGQQ